MRALARKADGIIFIVGQLTDGEVPMGFLKSVTDAINSKIKQVGGGSGTRKKGGGTASGGKGISQLRQDLGLNELMPNQQQEQSPSGKLAHDVGNEIAPSQVSTRQTKPTEVVRPTFGQQVSTAAPVGTASSSGTAGMVPTSTKAANKKSSSNDAYYDYFSDQGLTRDDLHHHIYSGYEANPSSPQDLVGVYSYSDPVNTVETIDDGTMDYEHLINDNMTGTQYLKYSELGMGGRPINQIDPSETYSKSSERRNYDFHPFEPDSTAMLNMRLDDVLDVPSEWASDLRDARTSGLKIGPLQLTDANDYTINVGDTSFSGTDFDRLSPAYMHQYDYYQRFQPERYLQPPADTDQYSAIVNEFSIPDINGNMTYHYGSLDDIEPVISIEFEDGSSVDVPLEFAERIVGVDENGNQYFDIPDGDIPTLYGDVITPQSPAINMTSNKSLMKFTDGSSVEVSPEYLEELTDESGNISTPKPETILSTDAHGILPDDLTSLNDIEWITELAKKNSTSPLNYANAVFVPNLMLSDGTSLPYDVAKRVYYDRNDEDDPTTSDDDDITYEFGNESASPELFGHTLLNVGNGVLPDFTNKPRRLMDQEIFTDESLKTDDIMDNLLDWSLGSAAISIPKVSWLNSASAATSSLHGIDPQTYHRTTDSSSLLTGYYDEDGNLRYGFPDDDVKSDNLRYWNALGNAMVPLTENLAGNVGSDPAKKLLEKAIGRSILPKNPTALQVLANAGVDALGEALEEEIGNPIEQLTQYGAGSDYYANEMQQGRDANGNLMYDEYGYPVDEQGRLLTDLYGRAYRDPETSASDRWENATDTNEILNAAAGGAGVSALMNTMLPIDFLSGVRRDVARHRGGVRQFVEPNTNNQNRHVSRSYSERFDDRVDRG